MGQIGKIILITLLGLLLLSGCSSVRYKLNAEDSGRTIELRQDECIQIKLDSNPTTGFAWEIEELDTEILAQPRESEYKSDSALIGSGGVETFTFEAQIPGQTTLRMIYHQPWEDVEPLEVFELTVIVGK